jgi:hypothetical protein
MFKKLSALFVVDTSVTLLTVTDFNTMSAEELHAYQESDELRSTTRRFESEGAICTVNHR